MKYILIGKYKPSGETRDFSIPLSLKKTEKLLEDYRNGLISKKKTFIHLKIQRYENPDNQQQHRLF